MNLVIVCSENTQRNKIAKKFKPLLKDKKLAVLAIPDNCACMDLELIQLLKNRVPKYVPIT